MFTFIMFVMCCLACCTLLVFLSIFIHLRNEVVKARELKTEELRESIRLKRNLNNEIDSNRRFANKDKIGF